MASPASRRIAPVMLPPAPIAADSARPDSVAPPHEETTTSAPTANPEASSPGARLPADAVDGSIAVHVLVVARFYEGSAGIGSGIVVVAVGRARRAVAVLVVRAAVHAVAVLIDAV